MIQAAPEWIEAHINLGTALYHLGRLDESRLAFRAAIKIDPQNSLAHFNLGCMCDRLGDLDEAIQEFRAALALAPEMAEAHLNLALVYEKTQAKSREHAPSFNLSAIRTRGTLGGLRSPASGFKAADQEQVPPRLRPSGAPAPRARTAADATASGLIQP